MLDDAWPCQPGAYRPRAHAAWLREPAKAPQLLVRVEALIGWLRPIVGAQAGPHLLRAILGELEGVGLLRPVPLYEVDELPAVVALSAAILGVPR